jgi:hypothetical protein
MPVFIGTRLHQPVNALSSIPQAVAQLAGPCSEFDAEFMLGLSQVRARIGTVHVEAKQGSGCCCFGNGTGTTGIGFAANGRFKLAAKVCC